MSAGYRSHNSDSNQENHSNDGDGAIWVDMSAEIVILFHALSVSA